MLYSISFEKKEITPLTYYDYKDIKGYEKDLENVIADNMGQLYDGENQLMTIFQERPWQEEPDILALNKEGDLFIFELKRGAVQGDTTIQVMRYTQEYGLKNYRELEIKYRNYIKDSSISLAIEHQEYFGLENPLSIDAFNQRQQMVIVGSSSDISLIKAVNYWEKEGLNISFIPYRIYKIGINYYFEFFSKPFDYHINPSSVKGVIFNTNRKYDENAVWDMLKNNKVSAYGSKADEVTRLKKDDYVLYYHSGVGVIAVGVVKNGKTYSNDENNERFKKVKLLTPYPDKIERGKSISPSELKELLSRNFFFSGTALNSYLSEDEVKIIVSELNNKYNQAGCLENEND